MDSDKLNALRKLLFELDRGIDSASDDDLREICDQIVELSPDPEILDYIFQSDHYCTGEGKLDAEAILKKVTAHSPILLS